MVLLSDYISGTPSSTQYVWEAYTMLEKRSTAGAILSQIFRRGQTIGGTSYYYSKDGLASIREMSDSTGTIQSQYTYDPAGRSSKLRGSVDSINRFAELYYHSASGLSLAVHRGYDSNLGRWINRDPIGERGGVNLFTYADNVPVLGRDTIGLAPNPVSSSEPPPVIIWGSINCLGWALGIAGAVGPGKGGSLSGALGQLGWSCHQVKSYLDCDCQGKKKAMVYPYFPNPEMKNPFTDPWKYGSDEYGRLYDWHAIRYDDDGQWRYMPHDWSPQDPTPMPTPITIGDPDSDFPNSQRWCCCKCSKD